jgi:hypothetical protein
LKLLNTMELTIIMLLNSISTQERINNSKDSMVNLVMLTLSLEKEPLEKLLILSIQTMYLDLTKEPVNY